jgi:hypothetical protein
MMVECLFCQNDDLVQQAKCSYPSGPHSPTLVVPGGTTKRAIHVITTMHMQGLRRIHAPSNADMTHTNQRE